jgi:NADH-quinone oxidoreductase subunit I
MEAPPHPMRLGEDEKDYYVREPHRGSDAEPVTGERV